MIKFFQRIKNFFTKWRKRKAVKLLESGDKKQKTHKGVTKEEMLDIYYEIKKGMQDTSILTEEQLNMLINMLKEEKSLKQKKVEQNKTQIKILQRENRECDKQRVLEIYEKIKQESTDLNTIDKKDLLKLRELFQLECEAQRKLIEQKKKEEQRIRRRISKLQQAVM